ncbi:MULTISPECIES: LysR family transcriptional regulator [unclassified Sphingomonas]|uniref:LysR family transcriptional regulator n=1 Tax=unclassified Sphingomonas TaxID=196159 RepID=UPI0007006DED|nr:MULTISPECIES: LysR family transcriptional regulator [unclassified Sphingomonas]KQX23236.1 LysR family transcriptional regulator [Sphingomonas sp. Root1294]KQY68084.1 LysR family transcriptional regulator [Sphingomonas sp. Root50]KRB90976.1 LysR family transcriptional regulator [Sphingomonas sp. Root720]
MTSPFDLNLRHLRALSAVIAQGSLSRGAEAAGLSQPALTQGLGKLERQIGVPLFERHSDGVSPTAAGLLLADRVARAFDYLAAGTRRFGRTSRSFVRPEQLMTASQLDAFLHFAAAQSFMGAAQASRLSQPAIHRAVRDLEQICAVPLAERRGRGVMLTAAGRALARGARLAQQEIAAGIIEVRGEDHEGGRVAIGAMPLSRALVLPRALAELLRAMPHAVIDVVEGSWRELIEPLADGIIDLTIGALRDEPPAGLVQEPLFTDQLAIFGRPGHPILEGPIDIATLCGQPWIVGPAGTPLRRHWEAMFADGPLPAVPVECGSVMVIRGMLAQSDLLTLLSPDQVALEVASGMLVQIGKPLPGAVRTIGLTTRGGWRPTWIQRELMRHIRDAVRDTRLQENR